MDLSDVLVIGGGPAGMMAAVSAKRAGAARVCLLEPNALLGRKLRITGKGRCNVTNDCSPQEMLQNVTRNQKFLYSAAFRFSPSDTKNYFEMLGVPLKTERGRRVFPVSDKAGDIAGAMVRDLHAQNVRVLRDRAEAVGFSEQEKAWKVDGQEGSYLASAVIIATGGCSYPATGSTGDGYRFAQEQGLKMVPVRPSLIPICIREDVGDMQGLSLKNVTLTLENARGKELFEELGEMLFTHFGISGPLALSASAHMQSGDVSEYRLFLDWKPGLDRDELDARLRRDFSENLTRDFCNSLGALLPRSAIPYIVRNSGIPEHKKVHQITREERARLVDVLKKCALTPTGFRPIDEAIVTCGGVSVGEIDPKTMMAKKCPGLFFAGEVLDLDAYTGGYNLQIAFATGHAAGGAAGEYAQKKKEEKTMKRIRIAIDGASGSGKSTLAKKLAAARGMVYVDTGAMYRTVALYVVRAGADPTSPEQVLPLLPDIRVELTYTEEGQRVLLNGEDVSDRIRTETISMAASHVSKIPEVRAYLTAMQKEMAERGGIVMDGRDIGTVVIPDAEVKIFMKTSPEVRARRRFEELTEKGQNVCYEDVLKDIILRDKNDSERDIAPLRAAQDAVILDNSENGLDLLLAKAMDIVEKKIGESL